MSFDRLLPAGLRWPGDVALATSQGEVSWGDLRARAQERAALFRERGARPGDRVAVQLTESVGTVANLLGAIEAGCLAMPLGAELPAAEEERRLRSASPRLRVRGSAVEARESPAPTESQAGLLVFSSGTTGRSRGVVLPLDSIVASARGVALAAELRRGDRWLNPLPLSHVGGLGVLFRCGLVGATAWLCAPFEAGRTAELLEGGSITHASLVARMVDRVLAFRPRLQARGLRCVLVGGGATSPNLLRRARQRGIPAVSTYGLTEAGSTVTLQKPSKPVGEPGDAGWPLPGRRLRVGSGGVIEVAGPNCMAGYWGEPPRTDWHPTGDLGRLEPDGRLIVLDRRADLVVTGGENVSPLEVESLLQVHEGIEEVAVVGVPHGSWGQELVAFVRGAACDDTAVLDRLARSSLSPWQRPRRWLVHPEPLPRNELGKLRRDTLRSLAEASRPEPER